MSIFSNLLPSTRNGSAEQPSAVRPVYEITESAEAYSLTAQLPGVSKENLDITGDGEELRIVGRRAWKQPEGWTFLYRETADETFELALTLGKAVNVDAIQAELRDGVLRLTLPKADSVKPRKIAVS